MKKLLSILLILTMCPVLIAGLQSCDTCGDDYDDNYPTFFKLKDGTLNSYFYKVDSLYYISKRYRENDTLPKGIPIKTHFVFNTERVAHVEPKLKTNPFATLQACDILIPYPNPTQKISKIDLLTKFEYGTLFKANDTISTYSRFGSIYPSVYSGEEFKDLTVLKDKFATNEFKFAFTPPQPNSEIIPFQLEAIITLSDGSVVKATSPKVYLGK